LTSREPPNYARKVRQILPTVEAIRCCYYEQQGDMVASTRERNGRYTGLYRDQAGKQRSAGTFSTEKQALQHAGAAELTGKPVKSENVYRLERRGKPTVAGYGRLWLAGADLEPTSRCTYQYSLRHVISGLGDRTLNELTTLIVRAFVRDLEARMSGSSAALALTVLRGMVRSAVADGLMERDVTATVRVRTKQSRQMTILQPEDYDRLVTAIPAHYQPLVELLVSTGLRWGEALGLRAGDVELRDDCAAVHVRQVVIEVRAKCSVRPYGKTPSAEREVTIDRELGERLIARAGSAERVFAAEKGGFVHRSIFRRVWVRALKEAGLSYIRVHDLRHTHASWILHAGVELVDVRDRLGHANIRTTDRYVHAMPGGEDKSLAAMTAIKQASKSKVA
jgi:integrase